MFFFFLGNLMNAFETDTARQFADRRIRRPCTTVLQYCKNQQEEYHRLSLSDAFPLGAGSGVEGVINVQRQHFGSVGRFAAGEGQVLIKKLEGVCQG